MNTTTADTDAVEDGRIDRYLEAVRAELADLSERERSDLLEDLEQHLREVAAEEDGSLEDRLGDPASYAAELRATVGYHPRPRGLGPVRAAIRTSRPVTRTRSVWRALVDHPQLVEFRDAARASRPLWWAVRGYALVLLLGLVAGDRAYQVFPIPRLAGSAVLGMLLAALAVVGSVRIGRRTDGSRGARVAAIVLNVLVVILALAVASTVRNRTYYPAHPASHATYEPAPEPAFHEGTLTGPDGRSITNLYPFGPDGEPLDGVTLYDQDGRPVEIVVDVDEDGAAIVTSYPLSADGRPVMHAYPQHQTLRPMSEDDADGWEPRGRPDVDAPILEASPSASDRPRDDVPVDGPTADGPTADEPSASPSSGHEPVGG